MFRIRTALVALACISIYCGAITKSKAEGSAKKAASVLECDTTTTPPPDSNFPKGFDYPQQVQGWVQSGNGDRMRLHGWCLFAGLNQQSKPNGPLHWQNWKTSTQAFPYQYPGTGVAATAQPHRPSPLNLRNAANAKVGGANAINNPAPVYPINAAVAKKYPTCTEQISSPPAPPPPTKWYQLKDGEHMQSNGDIMVAGVIYNDAAIKWITGQGLNNAVTLNSQVPSNPNSPPNTITQFPASSIVLKPMFWPVRKGGFTALPVWDWDANKPGSPADGKYAGYEMQSFWTRAVAITDLPNPKPPPKVQYLHGVYDSTGTKLIGPVTYDNTTQISPPAFQVVSVNDFYHRQLNQAELSALSTCDRALLDASAYWAYNRAFEPGDYVVLVAMHIMTKEQEPWTFQSLWYHPDADKCRYCQSRPTNLTDKTFQHYLLTTTYGTTQQVQDPNDHPNIYVPPNTQSGAPIWPVAYNPYIELAASHPITTNCMNCHHRAGWPPARSLLPRTSTYLQETPPNPPNPNVVEVYPWNASIFNGLLTLDAMWAVADRAGFPPGPKTGKKKK
jgi:hypothetical protein